MGTLKTPLPVAATATTAVAPAIGTTRPYNAAGSRTDTVNVTVASPVIADTSITANDAGFGVVGSKGIPAGCYVGTVIAGTSFRLSSSPTTQVDVPATATVFGASATIATGTLKPPLPALSGLRVGARVAVQKSAADTSSNPVIATCTGADTLDSGATTLTLKLPGEIRELEVHSLSGVKVWKVTGGNTPVGALEKAFAALAPSQAAATLFPTPLHMRGDSIDSFIARPLGSDPVRHPVEWVHDDTAGDLLHLTQGANMTGGGNLIALGVDNGGTGLFANNKKTGVGVKITNNNTITSALAFGLQVNSGSAVAPGAWFGSGLTNAKPAAQFVQNVLGDLGARVVEWRTSSFRTDSVTTTSGSPTIPDTALVAGDIGKIVTGASIPAQTYVGSGSIAGTSIRLSSSNTSQVDVNATASGATTVRVAQGNGDYLAGYVSADLGALVWQSKVSFQPSDTATVPVTVVGLAGQTANLVEWNVSGTGLVAWVSKGGEIYSTVRTGAQGSGASLDIYDTAGTTNARRFAISHTSGLLRIQAKADNNSSGGVGDLLFLGHATGNLGVKGYNSWGSASGGAIGLPNITTPPSGTPVGGHILYADTGALKGKGTSGTVTTIAAADPHCPDCGRDFALEWESDRYGYLALCMWCLTDGFTNGVIARRP